MKVGKSNKYLVVAPMMAWTDRHCRYLHRLYAPQALLFTEMVTTGALLHGGQWHQLNYDHVEHPVALQLGGNDPTDLAVCAERAQELGYDEVNLNVGCPSDRVQQGTFGAVLMLNQTLVAECVDEMQKRCSIPITVKCRLGVDEYDSDELLGDFVATVAQAGCKRFYVHARKAILGGLSPAQNRSIPPLQPQRVAHLKAERPDLEIIVNGGIADEATARDHLKWADGVMIGRAAYHHPDLLSSIHTKLAPDIQCPSRQDVLYSYRAYIAEQLEGGQRLHAMTRHMLSSAHGMPGARRYRQVLSDAKRLKTNNIEIVDEAFAQISSIAA